MYINITELLRLKGILNDTHGSIRDNLSGISSEISSINGNLDSSSLSRANGDMLEKISALSNIIDVNLDKLIAFLGEQIDKYQVTNDEAKTELYNLVNTISETFGAGGIILLDTANINNADTSEAVPEDTISEVSPEVENSSFADLSVYHSNPEKGFVVTTGNPTFDVSYEDRDLMYAVAAAESDKSYDDALAVSSVILNRCSNPNWVRSFGPTPKGQITGKGQFSVYKGPGVGAYAKYTGGNVPETVKKAVDDALNGVRNCSYMSFRSNSSTKFGNNMITASGNRYR
ncbi:MAG TPA: hypothetical protein DCY94_01555 [Firmicutes bacterium]|nr:hypothetical protein [Bacillota bacterium]